MFPLFVWSKEKVPSSDWCSGAPDVLFGWQLWRACYVHDQAYRKGYVKGRGKVDSREEADLIFYNLLERRANTTIALIFYWGVRVFGEKAWSKREEQRREWMKQHEQKRREV